MTVRWSRLGAGRSDDLGMLLSEYRTGGYAGSGAWTSPRTPDHRAIREAVREVCARFPDEYWAERDESRTFPWDFYAAMAKGGWIGVAHTGRVRRGAAAASPRPSIVLEEVAASGACNERREQHPPVDLRHAPGGQARLGRSSGSATCPASQPATCTSRSA